MKRFSKNLFSIMLSDVGRRVLGFFTVAYLARKIGADGFGIINIGFTILSYAIMASSAGLSALGTREIARGQSSEFVGKVVSLRLINAVAVFILVAITVVLFVPVADTAKLIILFCCALLPNTFVLDWYFQGKEEMGIIGVGRTASAAVNLLLILFFVHSLHDVMWVAIATIIGDSCTALILMKFYRQNNASLRLSLNSSTSKSLLTQSLPLGFGSILAHFSINVPPLVIAVLMTNADVGIYSAASKLVFFLLMLDRVLGTLLLPASARYRTYAPEQLSSMLAEASKWIFITALPLTLGGALLADKIVPIVFGIEYAGAITVFRILIWFFLCTMLHTIYTTGLVAIGQEKVYGRVMTVSFMIYTISIVVCTKLFGSIGAASAMVGSEAITLWLMRNRMLHFVNIPLPNSLFKTVLAGGIMTLVLVFMPPLNVFLTILLGAIVYIGGMFATKSVTAEELTGLLQRIR